MKTINNTSSESEIAEYSRLYVRQVRWSNEDACYVGALPELCGDCCHGDSEEEVYRQLDEIAYGYSEDKARGRGFFRVPAPNESTRYEVRSTR